MFISLGLSGVIPTLHYIITDGFYHAMYDVALGWLALMAFLYIFGAIIYALRVPERIWPGKFDIWVSCQMECASCVCISPSHQLPLVNHIVSYIIVLQSNQSINQTSIALISPAKPGSVARQPNQCSTAKSRKQTTPTPPF